MEDDYYIKEGYRVYKKIISEWAQLIIKHYDTLHENLDDKVYEDRYGVWHFEKYYEELSYFCEAILRPIFAREMTRLGIGEAYYDSTDEDLNQDFEEYKDALYLAESSSEREYLKELYDKVSRKYYIGQCWKSPINNVKYANNKIFFKLEHSDAYDTFEEAMIKTCNKIILAIDEAKLHLDTNV